MKTSTGIILAIILIAVLAFFGFKKKDTTDVNNSAGIQPAGEVQGVNAPSGTVVTHLGTIEELDNGCFADGICRMKVDGVWVEFNRGFYQGPIGEYVGALPVGSYVEIRGMKTDEGITIIGDNSYYIKEISK